MPDDPQSVEAAPASPQIDLVAAAAGPQAQSQPEGAAPASVTPAAEPDFRAKWEVSEQALIDTKGQIERLQRELQAAKSDGGNARALSRELREVRAQMAGIVAQLPLLVRGDEEAAVKAADDARRPYEAQIAQSIEEQQAGHAQSIIDALTRAGVSPARGGDWETNPEFATARKLLDKGFQLRDPEITGEVAELVIQMMSGRSRGQPAAQAQPTNGSSSAAAAKSAPVAPAKPRSGLDLDAGTGIGSGAITIDALVLRVADGYVPTAAEEKRLDDYYAQLVSGR